MDQDTVTSSHWKQYNRTVGDDWRKYREIRAVFVYLTICMSLSALSQTRPYLSSIGFWEFWKHKKVLQLSCVLGSSLWFSHWKEKTPAGLFGLRQAPAAFRRKTVVESPVAGFIHFPSVKAKRNGCVMRSHVSEASHSVMLPPNIEKLEKKKQQPKLVIWSANKML